MKLHRSYALEEYNPLWKETFKNISTKVTEALGDVVLSVEHIGSTSVEGMTAKPQVDILVMVTKIKDVENKYEEMKKAGFIHHGRGYVNADDDYFSLDNLDGIRIASIHILEKGNSRINEYLILRDYLRTHLEERDLYIEIKKELYSKYKNNYADYDNGKKGVISEIKSRANKWNGLIK